MINAKISLKVMHENLKKLKKGLPGNVAICAVVKANAYSLGDVTVSKSLEKHVHSFAVATLAEAKRLRTSGITKPILLFGVCENMQKAMEQNLVVTINSVAEMNHLIESSKNLKYSPTFHIKVNSGMNRYGVTSLWCLKEIIRLAKKSNIKIDGIYTHFSHEEDNIAEVDRQLRKFRPFVKVLKKYHPGATVHAACSGTAHYPPAFFDMIRAGKLLYGGYHGYKTAVTVTCKIVATHNIKPGDIVGYRGTFRATQPMKVGVLPCGYADLAHFNFGNKTNVLVGGVPCPIIGRVCMDSLMIDVTQIKNPLGKTATLIGEAPGLTIMELAKSSDTIACDLFCGMNFSRAKVTYE